MFRIFRTLTLGVVALAVALGGAATAYAQGENPPASEARTRWGGGQVTAIGDDQFTIRDRRGGEHVLHVDSGTRFFDRDAQPITFADLHVGDRVFGGATRRDDGTGLARLVIVFPPPTHYAGVGVITEVDEDEAAFHFVNRRGKLWEFYVDDDTAITNRAGNALSLGDLKPEMRAFVRAELRSDGKWWATEIKVGGPQPPAP